MGDWGIWGYCFFFHQITSINQTQLSSAIKLHVCFGKRRGLDFQRYYFTNGNKANWRMRIYAYAHSQCLTSIIGDKKANISTLGSLHYNIIKHYVSSFNLTNKLQQSYLSDFLKRTTTLIIEHFADSAEYCPTFHFSLLLCHIRARQWEVLVENSPG